jgi:hypothetical protein
MWHKMMTKKYAKKERVGDFSAHTLFLIALLICFRRSNEKIPIVDAVALLLLWMWGRTVRS